MSKHNSDDRAYRYAQLCEIELDFGIPLGNGTDGKVWQSNRNTAVKAFDREAGYWNERDSYLRLQEYGVTNIEGHTVPELVGYDDEIMIVEMTIVNPPCILDFAKCKIDRPPDFSEEVLQDCEEKGRFEFGRNWPHVKAILQTLESYQIYYLDPRPANIMFENPGEDEGNSPGSPEPFS